MATSMWCMSLIKIAHFNRSRMTEWTAGETLDGTCALGACTLQEHSLPWAHYSKAYHVDLRADGNVPNDVDVQLVSRPTEEAIELPPRTGVRTFFHVDDESPPHHGALWQLGQKKTTIDTNSRRSAVLKSRWETCHERTDL